MRCINSKKIVSLLLSVALLITMLPTSVSKAADANSVKITDEQFTGSAVFYNAKNYKQNEHYIKNDTSKSANSTKELWEMFILSNLVNTSGNLTSGFNLLNDAAIADIKEGLDGSTKCLRSIDVEIEVTGTLSESSSFTPYIYAKNNTNTDWYAMSATRLNNCTVELPTVTKPGTYHIKLTIDKQIKDCTTNFIDGKNAALYIATTETTSALDNANAVITLKSITFNKEDGGTDLTDFNKARAQVDAASKAAPITVKGQMMPAYYPSTARSGLLTALNETQTIKNTNTEEEVKAATDKLNTAFAALVSTQELWQACADALGKTKADYTEASWEVLDAAIDEALSLPDDNTVSEEGVAALKQNVTQAVEALQLKSEVPTENPLITKLKDAISKYRSRTEESYTPETWAEFKNARDAAQAVVDNPPADLTEETVNQLIDVLDVAANKMVLVDTTEAKAALKTVIDEIKAKDYKKADYTADSWEVFDNALKRAESFVTGTGQTTITAIDEAKEQLLQAEADLKKAQKVDKEDGVYLDYSGRWKKQDKDNSSMQGYVADGANATVNLDDWWFDIRDIDLSGLEYPVLEVEYEANGDTLQIAYNTTGTAGWNDANPVLTDASENSGKYKVSLADKKDMKYLLLTSNSSSLEYKKVKIYDDKAGVVEEAKKALDEAVSNAGKLKKDDYTAESWAVLEKALEEAKKITDDSTVEEINAAKKAVDDAVKGLKKVETKPSASPSVTPPTQPSATPPAQPTKAPQTNTPAKKGAKVTYGKLVYKVTKAATAKKPGTLTVTALSKAGKKASKLSIPATATIKGYNYKVTKLGNNALKGAKAKSVALGKNITAIPKGAFASCKKLTTLTVKAKLKSVKKGAFKGCKKTIKVKGSTKKNRKANVKLLKKSGYKKFK